MTSKKVHLSIGLAFFALQLVYCVAGFYLWLYPPGSDAAWRGSGTYGDFYIDRIDPGSPAGDLRQGDKIIAINGVKLTDNAGVLGDEYRMPPGSLYTMTVRRDGRLLTFSWHTLPRQRGSFPLSKLLPLLFWLSGLSILLLKPEDRQAWLLALMLGSFSTLIGGMPGDLPPNGYFVLISLARIAGLFSLPLLFHLFLYFPQTSPWLARWPRLTTWLYFPQCLFVLPTFGLSRLPMQWSVPIFSWPPFRWLNEHGLLIGAYLTLIGYILASLITLWLGYRMADLTGRRRLRVVMWGSSLGFGSVLLLLILEALNIQNTHSTIWDWLESGTILTLPLIPLSFAYAIIRHRVIPISLILRRGVRYVLVSHGSILLEMLIATLVATILVNWLLHHFSSSPLLIAVIAAVTSAIVWRVAGYLRQRYLAPLIDRRFFRQAYDAQQILAELADSLHTTNDIPLLIEAVANRLQSALQIESATIYLPDSQTGNYVGVYRCLYNAQAGQAVLDPPKTTLLRSGAIVAALENVGNPIELDGIDPAFDLTKITDHSQLNAQEREALQSIRAVYLLPLKTKKELLGIVALGSRLGDLPFSGEDKRLLQSVGASAALALENAQLIDRMLVEAKRRQEIEAENEQRAKEMEEARQLQLSMLPIKVPNLPHVEIAAYMKTATEVGGDYYDFYVGADGTLTIAIGDATGHGLKAGTMVTATKGLFNHLAAQEDLVSTLTQTSRALKKMNLRSLFMAMALIRLNGNHLQCSVAGMPPIYIYRAATNFIEEIPLRGAPLGGFSNYPYRQSETTLSPGDLVLLLSDGLPERFNADGEMFGYERCQDCLIANAAFGPETIIRRLVQSSEEWADGRPADDDMTFVALKIKAEKGAPIL